jgi:tripartite-type tricarboxylate transporter receptor subunit TctC
MQVTLGQNVIVENIGGASGTLGTGRVVRAAPDGYIILSFRGGKGKRGPKDFQRRSGAP